MLKEKLQQMIEKSAGKVPLQAKAIMQAGVQEVAASIASRSIPAIGEELPAFELPDSTGNIRNSKELVDDSHVILTFFRGGW